MTADAVNRQHHMVARGIMTARSTARSLMTPSSAYNVTAMNKPDGDVHRTALNKPVAPFLTTLFRIAATNAARVNIHTDVIALTRLANYFGCCLPPRLIRLYIFTDA